MTIRSVTVGPSGGKIYYPREVAKPLPAVVIVHGWKSRLAWYHEMARMIAKLGYATCLVPLGGHGLDDGDRVDVCTIKDHMDTVRSTCNMLAQRSFVDSQRLHILGISYGGFLAARMTAERHFVSVVLRAPAVFDTHDMRPVAQLIEGDEADAAYRQNEANPLFRKEHARLSLDDTQHVLVVESGRDEEISPSTIMAYIESAPPARSTLVRYETANHGLTDPLDRERFKSELMSWYRRFA